MVCNLHSYNNYTRPECICTKSSEKERVYITIHTENVNNKIIMMIRIATATNIISSFIHIL